MWWSADFRPRRVQVAFRSRDDSGGDVRRRFGGAAGAQGRARSCRRSATECVRRRFAGDGVRRPVPRAQVSKRLTTRRGALQQPREGRHPDPRLRGGAAHSDPLHPTLQCFPDGAELRGHRLADPFPAGGRVWGRVVARPDGVWWCGGGPAPGRVLEGHGRRNAKTLHRKRMQGLRSQQRSGGPGELHRRRLAGADAGRISFRRRLPRRPPRRPGARRGSRSPWPPRWRPPWSCTSASRWR